MSLIFLGACVWVLLGLALGYVIGGAAKVADQKAEQQRQADLAAAMRRHPAGRRWTA